MIFLSLEVGGMEANEYLHVYDNFFTPWVSPQFLLSYYDRCAGSGDCG